MKDLRWWLLLEDENHENFAKRLLEQLCGAEPRIIRADRPKGGGDASEFVIREFPDVLKKALRRKPGENRVLVVVIDGDGHGVAKRRRSLEDSLRKAGADAIADTESVIVLVPTRNIETWLNETSASEAVNYKSPFGRWVRADFERAARRILGSGPDLPSVLEAREEIARLRAGSARRSR